jgi:predicted house-cleaning noncanonical NTP pyrophosphatase (MazG superfamily)
MRNFKAEKLIRDKFQQHLAKKDIKINTHALKPNELIIAFKEKLLEETNELISADNTIEITEEAADLIEVIVAFCAIYSITFDDVMSVKQKKAEQFGGFNNHVYATSIEIENDNPNIEYYLKKADKYPEIKKEDVV